MIRRTAPALLLATALGSSLLAAETKGYFHFGEVRFEVTDTLAFTVDTADPKKPMTAIVMADFPIDRVEIAAAIDPVQSLVAGVYAREKGNFVVVKLHPPDQCGVYAYLTSGERPQSIGLSEDFPATVSSSTASRAAGICFTKESRKFFDDSYDFRLPFDVKITDIPKPSKLPADGGEPGRALVALTKAIQAKDWKTAKPHLGGLDRPQRDPDDLDHFFYSLSLNYPKSATPTGGLIKGNRAQVEMKGTNSEDHKITGTFLMEKVDGKWRVMEHVTYSAE